jgi:probable lipoprotein NlpC
MILSQNSDLRSNFSQLRLAFLFISLSILLSSCKIFRSNKSTANTTSTSTNTHSHTKKVEAKAISKANDLISLARTYTGVPYKSGGTTDTGMDCSGLIYTVCQNVGLSIPRISYKQAEIGEEVSLKQIQKGDLLFFNTSSTNRISHVGMVTEVNQPTNITFIHSSTSKGVREDNLFSDYWKKAFTKATRPFVF